MEAIAAAAHREPRNKDKIVGQEAPFNLKDIWALRVRLQMENRVRELAPFDLGIDSAHESCTAGWPNSDWTRATPEVAPC